MKRGIPPEVREEAALICAIAASTPDFAYSYDAAAEQLGLRVGAESLALALSAWFHCEDTLGGIYHGSVLSGEAEALLRSGWIPEWSR